MVPDDQMSKDTYLKKIAKSTVAPSLIETRTRSPPDMEDTVITQENAPSPSLFYSVSNLSKVKIGRDRVKLLPGKQTKP